MQGPPRLLNHSRFPDGRAHGFAAPLRVALGLRPKCPLGTRFPARLPGFGAAPQIPVPQHKKASVASGPKAARNAASHKTRHAPPPQRPFPQALRAAQRPQETRHAAKRGMPPTPQRTPPRKRCERPKGRKKRGMPQNAACPSRPSAPSRKRCERPKGRKKRGRLQSAACPSRPSAPHPRKRCEQPKDRKKRGKPQETRHAAKRRLHPQSPPTPAHPPNLPPAPPPPSIT